MSKADERHDITVNQYIDSLEDVQLKKRYARTAKFNAQN